MPIPILDTHLLLEQMRATVRYIVGVCGWPRVYVAREAGVSAKSLRRLMDGGYLNVPQFELLEAYCRRYGLERAYAEQAALSLLLSGIPARIRPHMREQAVRYYRAVRLFDELPVPEWVEYEMAGLLVMGNPQNQTRRARMQASMLLAHGLEGEPENGRDDAETATKDRQ